MAGGGATVTGASVTGGATVTGGWLELQRYCALLAKVRRDLVNVRKGIKGLVVMSAELDAAYAKLLFQQVPTPWGEAGKGYPSLKPLGSWFKDLVARFAFMADWLAGGPPPSYWISAFFFPQGFFTSALQAYARKYREPIDLLAFVPTVKLFAGLDDVDAPDRKSVV